MFNVYVTVLIHLCCTSINNLFQVSDQYSSLFLFKILSEEDIPDDRSLQSLIRKERRTAASQYYDDNNYNGKENDPSPANKLLFDDNVNTSGGGTSTNFVSAPKDYDPIKSGFMNPEHSKKAFYESDEDDAAAEAEENMTKGASTASSSNNGWSSDSGSSGSIFGKRQATFEPAIEVVLNANSRLNSLY